MTPSRHSIRFRLSVSVTALFGLLAVVFLVGTYLWFGDSLAEEVEGFALHEADEVAQAVAGSRDLDSEARETLLRLMPEPGVLSLEVWTLDGQLVYQHPAARLPVAWPEGVARALNGEIATLHGATPAGVDGVRAARPIHFARQPRWVALTLVSRRHYLDLLARFRLYGVTGFAASLCLVFAVSWWALGRALRPVQDLVREAMVVSQRHSGGRLAEPPPGSELADLAALLNRMLSETETTLDRLRTFAANAGHELRTPLARMRGELEQALGSEDPEEQKRVFASLLEEIESMRVLLNGLLDLAHGDDPLTEGRERIDLADLVCGVASEAILVGGERGVRVEYSEEAESTVVWGSAPLLRRLVWNLVDNALRVSTPGGGVELRLVDPGRGRVGVEVEDEGPGVDASRADDLFEPFVHGAPGTGGAHGLGLALARAIARRHGGDLEWVEATQLGGAAIRASLPLA